MKFFPLCLIAFTIVGQMAGQVNTVCSLYGNTTQCTSYDTSSIAAEQQREAYETGQAIGNSIGKAIFRAHFPGWRRKYCAKHPAQPFVYSNAAGDSISGTCPDVQGLANEVAQEWVAKHSEYTPTPANGQRMVVYVAEHHLSFFEKKSYDAAYASLGANGQLALDRPTSAMPANQDLFVWFDETVPPIGAPLFDVVVTARAYDGAISILQQARQGNTATAIGTSVLDSGYHPATVNLVTWRKNNPGAKPVLFFWRDESVSDTTLVMHFNMTQRAYEQMLALMAGSDLRMRPAQ